MKRLLIVVGVLIIFLAGCGGGGGVSPTVQDLTSIMGVWDAVVNFSGEISYPGGKIPINDNFTDTLHIARDKVQTGNGDYMVWAYDGATLQLEYSAMSVFHDANCGDILFTIKKKFNIPINGSTTVTTMTGTGEGSGTSEYCTGTLNLYVTYNGNLSKHQY